MIRDWNIDTVFSQFARKLTVVALDKIHTATDHFVGSFVMPCAGVLLSVKASVAQVSGSIDARIHKNSTTISTATITTTGVLAFTLSSADFADGDVFSVQVHNMVDTEILRGGVTFEWRPDLSPDELAAPNTNS